MNFRDAYEFDPETYAGEGGLLARLRALLPQQETYGSATPNAAREAISSRFGSPQGGLLARLLALQGEQSRYQPMPESGGRSPLAARDPNFRQPSWAPAVIRPQGAIGPSNLTDDQSTPTLSPFSEGAGLDLLRTSQLQQGQYQQTAANNKASQRRILAQSIIDVSRRLGIEPEHLATAISYETAGTFDPWKTGPITKQYGQHRGLIQWGEPQARHYGVTKDSTIREQMEAVGKYLRDSGVTSRMGLLDIYSAINTGHVGRYDLSDANNGGAPGTVADKVDGMGDHRRNASRLLAEAPKAFPAAPEKPVRILSRRTGGGSYSYDSDTPTPEWTVPSLIFDPRR